MINKPYGITGSIASGKSEVTSYLEQKGYTVIDADKVSHETTKKNNKGYNCIIEHFSENILDEEKNIDRKKLSSIVFADKNKLTLLNQIIHPIIKEEIENKILKYQKENKIFFLDVPLLFESKLENICKKIILIYCDEKIQMERIIKRDKIDKESARKIISSQMPLKEKMEKSDILIENNSSIEELHDKVDKIIIKLERNEID